MTTLFHLGSGQGQLRLQGIEASKEVPAGVEGPQVVMDEAELLMQRP